MINSSEVKDARINLDGDKLACQKWLPFAYSKLAFLWDNYKKTKMVSSKAFKPDSETTIICAVKPGGNKWIYIKSGKPNLTTSGIIRSSYIDYSDNTLYEFLPKNAPFPKQWKNTSKLATKPSAYYNIPLTGNTSQHKYIKASMYSGNMRQYMQMILGINVEQKFDYKWEKTHAFHFQTFPTLVNGVYEFQVNGAKNQFWLVQIGKDGMFISRADVYIPVVKKNSDLDSFPFIPQTYEFPTGDALTAAIANKTAYQIYSATEMADFYGSSFPFFKECGWSSFGGSGGGLGTTGFIGSQFSSYQNICYRQVNGIWTSQVWTIGLTITPIQNSSTVIISKYKQLNESGRMWSSSPNTGINVPDYDNNCIKTLSFNGFDKPYNGIFNFPWYVSNGITYYSSSVNVSLEIPFTGIYQSGSGETVDLSYRTNVVYKNPLFINNGIVTVYDYKANQTSGVSPFIITSREIGYVVPMYDREAVLINIIDKRRAFYYDKNTGVVTDASDPVRVDPINNSGNLGNLYFDNESLTLLKIGSSANGYFPLRIMGSTLNTGIINESNNQNNGIHVECVSNVFTNVYNDFNFSTPYTNLYRATINGVVYSYLIDYVNYSAIILSNQGTNNVACDTYPVYGGDEITNFSFVGKP